MWSSTHTDHGQNQDINLFVHGTLSLWGVVLVFHAGAPTLKDTDILELVGIANNTTLHVRACVLGGMPIEQHRGNAAQGRNARTSFNKQMGEFSSNYSETRYLDQHEGTNAHNKHLQFWRVDSDLSNSNTDEPRRCLQEGEYLRGNLGRILANLGGRKSSPDILQNIPSDFNNRPIEMDWSRANLSDYHQDSFQASNAINTLAADLQQYILHSEAVDADSDNEEAELDEAALEEHTCVDQTDEDPNAIFDCLQQLCGIQSLRYQGALGNLFYVNDFAAIVAQEMANPCVRLHLHFLPEDAGSRLAEAWQGHQWLHELDSELTTPMVRLEGQDYYIFEPALLRDSQACVPYRWFIHEDHIWARTWTMTTTGTSSGHQQWVVLEHLEVEIPITSFSMAFPHFQRSFLRLKVPSPQSILGIVMLSSIGVNALIRLTMTRDCQKSGIWAWDCILQEAVLVIPSVLAMLGDNPMQSEMACHIGLQGKRFCHACWVARDEHDDIDEDQELEGQWQANSNASSVESGPHTGAEASVSQPPKQKRARKNKESMPDMISHITHFMNDMEHCLSPVWRIKDLNPYANTPVEILHVILIGFVKYFWLDAVARIAADKKPILMARLSSFDTSGLNIPPLAGYTLVKYAGSLTGQDFRAIAQAAPFVLHNLGLTDDQLHAWVALSALISLVWQPNILDINHYLFGPPMLFATEGFESFNAIIRAHSIHSNCYAPSRDIAKLMLPWLATQQPSKRTHWITIGPQPRELVDVNDFGLVQKAGKPLVWMQTVTSELGLAIPPGISSTGVRSPMRVMAANGDWCDRNAWVLISPESGVDARPQLGLVKEVLQGVASGAESRGMANWIVIQRATVGTPHDLYHMPQVSLLANYTVVCAEAIQGTVNVLHNCRDMSCTVIKTRPVYQERKQSKQHTDEVIHSLQGCYILNTCQMRNQSLLKTFCPPTKILDHAQVVFMAVRKEIDMIKAHANIWKNTPLY
ncbi:hypothetical protein HETIRDRAFT_119480 [Heterobasidion irregulare TC 32-1]|uniref:Uncharacterized protein n=1 Tax=Heterobasidion irregulare (strain TC 32-1) TaxID=747525 RepID=W4KE81_HETIT|nr:uncharacterized protein HETIRDRAFT_119480 [Heterobasidion irregulare TC 32-1]ETW83356.1 hypothetical protein HETIRDRAFT_119480 [Heterobasidion irregulare TC 32-1]